MDTDSNHEHHPETGEGESNADEHLDPAVKLPGFDGTDTMVTESEGSSQDNSRRSAIKESREERWQRLQNHYNDQYLKLFNQHSVDTTAIELTDLDPTQIGAVTWSTLEKEKFFNALSRRSKADIRAIAIDIGSKSELEVYEYLRLLEDEDRNRNLYAEEVLNATYPDIPAAAELSGECETLLEQAADALTVYQDRFDRAVGEQMHPDGWLVDLVQARAYDKLFNDAEDSASSDDGSGETSSIPAGGLFRLSSWLLLTERVFMNSDPSQNDNNWATQAAQDEMPAITQGAISDLHSLALFHLRKVMQTAILCAESRMRCTKDKGYDTKALVREQDVTTAISVLGLPEDRSQFWLKLARRNQVKVVNNNRKKDQEDMTVLNYNETERILSQTPTRRRRRGSASSISESMSQTEDSDYMRGYSTADIVGENESLTSDESDEQATMKQDRYAKEHGDVELSGEASNFTDDEELDFTSQDQELATISKDDEDAQAEISDLIASRRHELQLYHELGWTMPEDGKFEHFEEVEAKEETSRSGRRKSKTELLDWRDSIFSYAESWEEHGGSFDEAFFGDNRRETKRRKTEGGTDKQHNLPLRCPG